MLVEGQSTQEMTELVSTQKDHPIAIRMNWMLDWGTQIENGSGQEDNPVVPSRPSQVAWMQRSWRPSPEEPQGVEDASGT
jgi:hypothetical protein